RNLESPAAERTRGDVLGAGSVHYDEAPDVTCQRRLAAKVPHAEQVAFALLAGVGDEEETVVKLRQPSGLPCLRHRQQSCQPCSVIRYAGPAESTVRIDVDVFFQARSEHRIQ